MKQLFFLSVAIIVFSSCHFVTGSGNIITQTRSVGNFKRINASSGFEVELKQGPVTEVVIEADDNVIKHLSTEVDGDILKISIENHYSLSNVHLKAYVTTPEITGVKASSGSSVYVKGILQNEGKLSFNASSAGRIETELDAPDVEASASSGATIRLTGKARNLDADISSGSSLKSGDLKTENVVIKASSGATATVNASFNINAKASSGAGINYFGEANVQRSVSSGGSVQKKE